MNQKTTSFQTSPSESPTLAQPPEAAIYTDPDDVMSDPRLTSSQKRAVLASWMSDARAVENSPGLRRLDSGAIVEFDAIRRSLNSLEPPERRSRDGRHRPIPSHRRPSVMSRLLSRVGSLNGSNDNDDDPPPAPAGVAFPFRPTFVSAYGARPQSLPGPACAAG